jgi:hypothetical protein
MLVLERLKGWSLADPEREMRASLVYRLLTRAYLERVPAAKTLIRSPPRSSAERWGPLSQDY